jgi:isoamylase
MRSSNLTKRYHVLSTRRHSPTCTSLLVAFLALVALYLPARAQINAQTLGARYDATQTNITFRVYSSRATRIELDLFATAYGAAEVAKYALAKDADNVWSVTVPVADLHTAGINSTPYYGYRAWGPNWPYVPTWTKNSLAGFVADVDPSGNRFNPNKLLFDPYTLELSHDPLNPHNNDATIFASGSTYRQTDSGPAAPPRASSCRSTHPVSAPNPHERKKTISSTKCTSAA